MNKNYRLIYFAFKTDRYTIASLQASDDMYFLSGSTLPLTPYHKWSYTTNQMICFYEKLFQVTDLPCHLKTWMSSFISPSTLKAFLSSSIILNSYLPWFVYDGQKLHLRTRVLSKIRASATEMFFFSWYFCFFFCNLNIILLFLCYKSIFCLNISLHFLLASFFSLVRNTSTKWSQ